jgi:hypothetical protein
MDARRGRYQTFLEAFTSRRVLVFGGIIAFAGLIYRAAPEIFSWWGSPMILGTSPLAITVVIVLLIVAVVLFEFAHRKRLETIPRFALSFDQHSGGIVITPTTVQKIASGIIEETPSHGAYVCIKIENQSKLTIKECFAFVTAILKKDSKTGSFMPLPLNYAVSITPAFNLYPNIPHFVSFLKAGEIENTMEIHGPWPLSLTDAFLDKTTYRVTVAVVVADLTKAMQIDVMWPGIWDGISAVPYNHPTKT